MAATAWVDDDTAGLFAGIPGLVWAYRFSPDGSATALPSPVDPDTVRSIAPGEWLWLHFAQTNTRAVAFIAQLPLPPRARAALVASDDHLSLHLEGDTAFGVLADWQHALEDEFAPAGAGDRPNEEREIGRLHFTLSEGLVVSMRRRALHSVHAIRGRVDAGHRFDSAPRVLESIVEQFARSIAEVAREIADALDGVEDRVLAERIGDERRDLGALRRRAVRMHRPLKALRRVIAQFEQRHQRASHAMVEVAARLLQRFDELDSDIVVIQDRARLLHEEVSAKLSDQTNRQLYALSILSALFLPPTLVVGVFGMNTKGLPLTESADGFLIALALCVASSALVYGLLRRIGVR